MPRFADRDADGGEEMVAPSIAADVGFASVRPIDTEGDAISSNNDFPPAAHGALPTFQPVPSDTPLEPDADRHSGDETSRSSTGRFNNVVLSVHALKRRRWVMTYVDPLVETEFILFSNRSPWPFPFIVTLCALNASLLYFGPMPDPCVLGVACVWLALAPAAILFSETARKYLPPRFVVTDKTRALFIEHAVMPALLVTCVLTVTASSRNPAKFASHKGFSWHDVFTFETTDPQNEAGGSGSSGSGT
jgi:hypothetical protein